MDRDADPNWAPSPETLPEAGRVMFRVDTTLDDPIRTSVLCGACGNLSGLMAASRGHSGARYAPWICGTKRRSRSQPAIVKREYALRLAMMGLDNREKRIMAILRDSTAP